VALSLLQCSFLPRILSQPAPRPCPRLEHQTEELHSISVDSSADLAFALSRLPCMVYSTVVLVKGVVYTSSQGV
jgi:hypothetical protein